MVFHWILSDHKSPQVSRTLLSILADLDNAVVWMGSTFPLISKSSSPFNNSLVTVPKAPITIGINLTFILSFFSLSFNFTKWSVRTVKSTILQVLFLFFFLFFFLLTITRSGRLAEIKWSVGISKSQRSLCISFSRRDSGLWIYYLFAWSNFNFLQNSQWITLPTQSCYTLSMLISLFILVIIISV